MVAAPSWTTETDDGFVLITGVDGGAVLTPMFTVRVTVPYELDAVNV
jgi:hypothetical protein